MASLTLLEVLVWFFIIFLADISAVVIEYRIFKPKSNDTIVAKLNQLAKELSKKRGYKKRAKQLEKISKDLQTEVTNEPPNA